MPPFDNRRLHRNTRLSCTPYNPQQQPRQRHPLWFPPPWIASTTPRAAVPVAAAPYRGDPLARPGTWQRHLALGDGRVGGVREHAIHAVAEDRRVQVGTRKPTGPAPGGA
jgi:hypothetical protein